MRSSRQVTFSASLLIVIATSGLANDGLLGRRFGVDKRTKARQKSQRTVIIADGQEVQKRKVKRRIYSPKEDEKRWQTVTDSSIYHITCCFRK